MLDMRSGTKMDRCNRKQSNTLCCMVCQSGTAGQGAFGLLTVSMRSRLTGRDVEARVTVNEDEHLRAITAVGTSADGEAGVEPPDD